MRPLLVLFALLLSPSAAASGHPWLDAPAELVLLDRFPAPEGHARVPVESGSYADFLRGLPIVVDRSVVRAHDGRELDRPAAALVDLDVGRGDLQQCADSAIRLHAEYLWARGRADEAAYHFTSGDRSSWSEWSRGERFVVDGARVRRVRRAPTPGRTAFRAWLQHLFRYAGSRSLGYDTEAVAESEALRAGDLFVEPGSPGHVVVVLDVAEGRDGRRLALLGQGFMPAEEFHVLRSEAAVDGVWFRLPGAGESVSTPSWRPFARADARRFKTR